MAGGLDETISSVMVTGIVINGSGGNIPRNSIVRLTIYQNNQKVRQYDCPIDDLGRYTLLNIPWSSDFAYDTSISYNGIVYHSEMVEAGVISPSSEIYLPLIIYENSTSSQSLHALRMRVAFDFNDAGIVHISESILISNPTSLVIIPTSESVPVLYFPLPEGAQDVNFPEGNVNGRFRTTGKGFGDWHPIMPGDGHQVLVEYSLPFNGQRSVSISFPIAVDSILVLVTGKDIQVSGSDLDKVNTVPATDNATAIYNAPGLRSGGKLFLTFSTKEHLYKEWIGGILLVLTLLVSTVWLIRRQRILKKTTQQEKGDSEETILDAIIALDDRFKAGELKAATYQQIRAEFIQKIDEIKRNRKR